MAWRDYTGIDFILLTATGEEFCCAEMFIVTVSYALFGTSPYKNGMNWEGWGTTRSCGSIWPIFFIMEGIPQTSFSLHTSENVFLAVHLFPGIYIKHSPSSNRSKSLIWPAAYQNRHYNKQAMVGLYSIGVQKTTSSR